MKRPQPGLVLAVAKANPVHTRPADLEEIRFRLPLYSLTRFNDPNLARLVPIALLGQRGHEVVFAGIFAPAVRDHLSMPITSFASLPSVRDQRSRVRRGPPRDHRARVPGPSQRGTSRGRRLS